MATYDEGISTVNLGRDVVLLLKNRFSLSAPAHWPAFFASSLPRALTKQVAKNRLHQSCPTLTILCSAERCIHDVPKRTRRSVSFRLSARARNQNWKFCSTRRPVECQNDSGDSRALNRIPSAARSERYCVADKSRRVFLARLPNTSLEISLSVKTFFYTDDFILCEYHAG